MRGARQLIRFFDDHFDDEGLYMMTMGMIKIMMFDRWMDCWDGARLG